MITPLPWKKILIFASIVILIGCIGIFLYNRFFVQEKSRLSCATEIGENFIYNDISVRDNIEGHGFADSKYPGCDTNDIFLWTCEEGGLQTQIWSACNIGAKQALTENSDNEDGVGDFFAWGSNEGVSLGGKKTTHSNAAWYQGVLASIGFLDLPSEDWGIHPEGPCAPGYHVPTLEEWNLSLELTKNAISSILMLPNGGFLHDENRQYNQKEEGHYWSSTPAKAGKNPFSEKLEPEDQLAYSTNIFSNSEKVFTTTPTKQNTKFSIRCIRNSLSE